MKKLAIERMSTSASAMPIIKKLQAANPVPGRILLAAKGNSGKVYAYLDSVQPSKELGRVSGIEVGEWPDDISKYAVTLTGVKEPKTSKEKWIIFAEYKPLTARIAATDDDNISPSDHITERKRQIVDNQIASAEEVDEAVAIMQSNRVHPSVINWVLSTWEKRDNAHRVKVAYQDMLGKESESFLSTALISQNIWAGLVLQGPKSTGKNVFAETVAQVLHLPYYRINFTRDMLLEDVFGSKSTDNSAANAMDEELAHAYTLYKAYPERCDEITRKQAGKFELLKAKSASVQIIHTESVIMDWARNGGILMLDEINMADANMLQQIVNPIADTEKVLLVPGEGEIPLHRSCFVMAGMNPGYAGTSDLNEATASRLGVLKFDYSGSISAALQANFTEKLPKNILQEFDRFYDNCRKMVASGEISDRVLNLRGFVHALTAYLRFPEATSLVHQIVVYVINGCEDDERERLYNILYDQMGDL